MRQGISLKIPDLVTALSNAATLFGVNDQFNTAESAPMSSPRNAEPGPGSLNVTDTAGTRVSISGGSLEVVGNGGWNQAGFYFTPGVTRAAGRVLRMGIDWTTGNGQGLAFVTTDQNANFSGYNNVGLLTRNTELFHARRTTDGTSPVLNQDAIDGGDWYMVLRNTGKYLLHDSGSDVDLLWWDDWDSTATLYLGATHFTSGFTIEYDNVQAVETPFFDIGSLALSSDSFNRANGALGSTDGAGHAEANGGSGNSWTQSNGVWVVSANEAESTVLGTGFSAATVDASTGDLLIECDLTRSGGNVGIVARYTDINNFIRAYHDGTNCVMQEVVSGTATTRITAAATYSEGASIRLHLDGTRALLYYNDLYVGTYASVAAGLTGTLAGMYTTDILNTLDNFVLFGRYGYNGIRMP